MTMLKTMTAKLLVATLAVLALIGGLLVHQKHVNEQVAASAAKAVALIQQQQKDGDDVKKKDAASEEHIRQIRARQNNGAGHSSKTWQHYVP